MTQNKKPAITDFLNAGDRTYIYKYWFFPDLGKSDRISIDFGRFVSYRFHHKFLVIIVDLSVLL